MSGQSFDSSCKKCGAEMPAMPPPRVKSAFDLLPMKITGYRCKCGHWNNLKKRKGFLK